MYLFILQIECDWRLIDCLTSIELRHKMAETLKYIKINENACVGVAKFRTITRTWIEFTNFNLCRHAVNCCLTHFHDCTNVLYRQYRELCYTTADSVCQEVSVQLWNKQTNKNLNDSEYITSLGQQHSGNTYSQCLIRLWTD